MSQDLWTLVRLRPTQNTRYVVLNCVGTHMKKGGLKTIHIHTFMPDL